MQVIKDFFINNNIKDTQIAVGVSGGSDSLALVLMLKETFPDLDIIALTVDHGLRPSSLDEAVYVKQVMQKYNIKHHVLTWEGDKPKTGIEEQARIARYNLLTTWCKENNIKYLAIAHHILDQAETFLMRIERGSGLFGLSAMNEISQKDGITILRPLLAYHPNELKDYLMHKKINWVEDESNDCDDFLRVRMRKFLPTLENEIGISPKRLSETVENLQRTKKFLEDVIEATIEKDTHCWNNLSYSFDFAKFINWHDEIKFHILGRMIKNLGDNQYTPEADVLLNTIASIKDDKFESTTIGGCIILKSDLKLWVIKEYRDKNLNYSSNEWEYFIKLNPTFRGIKIPHKLKIALLKEKK